jgi:hypothetical protein
MEVPERLFSALSEIVDFGSGQGRRKFFLRNRSATASKVENFQEGSFGPNVPFSDGHHGVIPGIRRRVLIIKIGND